MRVAYVCADPGVPVFGRKGCSIHVQEVLRALLRQGVQVELFATRWDGEPPQGLDGVPLRPLPEAPKGETAARERRALKANAAIASGLARHGPFDLVYERYSLWSFAAMEHAQAAGAAGLLEVNAPLIEEQKQRRDLVDEAAAERAAERAFQAATALLAVSKEVANYLQRRGVEGKRIVVAPNGVDPRRFAQSSPARERDGGAFTIGFVGTLKPWHGLETLMDAFALLRRRDASYRLLLVGDGPMRGPLEAHLAAQGTSVLAAVEFVGSVRHEDVPRWLALMDVATAPYPNLPDFYFSPLKVYEYMAAGLPLVASRIGQLSELIDDGANGLLAAPGDAAALAEAIQRLRHDPALRRRLGQAARAEVTRRHTWDSVAQRILGCLQRPPIAAIGSQR